MLTAPEARAIDEADVSGSSVAEATARAVCLLSFIRSLYEKHPVVVTKDGVAIPVGNIWKEQQLYAILFERGELPLEKYITTRFSGGKLDFSLVDDTHGFSLIDNENQNEFIDSFRKFEELDWNAIATDKGLDYKPYNKSKKSKRYFSDEQWKKGIKKFRITQRNTPARSCPDPYRRPECRPCRSRPVCAASGSRPAGICAGSFAARAAGYTRCPARRGSCG